MKPAPQIRDYKTPAEFVAACQKHLATLQGDGDGSRADSSEEDRADTDEEDRTDAIEVPPVMGSDPWAYARACEAHLQKRLDGKAHKVASGPAGRTDERVSRTDELP